MFSFLKIIKRLISKFQEKSSQLKENTKESVTSHTQLDGESRKDTTDSFPRTNSKFNEDDVKSVLSDFKNLDFNNSNERFNEIAEDYEKKKKNDLFDYVVLNRQKKIINILDSNLADLKKTNSQAYFERQEEFRKKYGRYILKIDEGMNYGKKIQDKLRLFENRAEEVLSDFEKLKFHLIGNKCEDSSDSINYNAGRPANPFDKIANYYRNKKDIFLFNYVILTKRKEIIDILDRNAYKASQDSQERFKVRLGRYLVRIEEGMNYAKELLKDNHIGFCDGCYWPNEKEKRYVNHYDHLSIDIKPEEKLETSRLFSEKTKRMEIMEHTVERVKIYSNGEIIVTIEKNKNGQRDYCFEKDVTSSIEIKWNATNEKGELVNCFINLNVNSKEFIIEKTTINGEDVKLKEILKLAEQNKDVLIEGKVLYKFLEKSLDQDVQSQEEEVIIPKATVPQLSSSFDSLKPGQLEAGCIGGTYDRYRPSTRLSDLSAADKSNPEYRKYDR